MGLWDVITGRSRPKPPQLDALFLVPSAAITLETGMGLRPTGTGSVCYRAATGNAFAQVQAEVVELLNDDPGEPDVETSRDEFGFTWLVVHDDPADPDGVSALCTDLHAVNASLEEHGFGPGLLCSLVPFAGADGRRVGLVYLYKQGTFYPFAPVPGEQRRDNLLELQIRDALAGELPMEADLGRWLAVWGAPACEPGSDTIPARTGGAQGHPMSGTDRTDRVRCAGPTGPATTHVERDDPCACLPDAPRGSCWSAPWWCWSRSRAPAPGC